VPAVSALEAPGAAAGGVGLAVAAAGAGGVRGGVGRVLTGAGSFGVGVAIVFGDDGCRGGEIGGAAGAAIIDGSSGGAGASAGAAFPSTGGGGGGSSAGAAFSSTGGGGGASAGAAFSSTGGVGAGSIGGAARAGCSSTCGGASADVFGSSTGGGGSTTTSTATASGGGASVTGVDQVSRAASTAKCMASDGPTPQLLAPLGACSAADDCPSPGRIDVMSSSGQRLDAPASAKLDPGGISKLNSIAGAPANDGEFSPSSLEPGRVRPAMSPSWFKASPSGSHGRPQDSCRRQLRVWRSALLKRHRLSAERRLWPGSPGARFEIWLAKPPGSNVRPLRTRDAPSALPLFRRFAEHCTTRFAPAFGVSPTRRQAIEPSGSSPEDVASARLP